MTSEVLRKLEAKGLIVRTVDAADTRAKKLRVTGRGAELAIQAIAVVEAADAAFFQVAADPAALLAMLRPLASDPQDSGTRLDLEAGRAS
jgi:DNA-binding MarR family transcriptional regulator